MGTQALCEALKTNGAITEIDLRCKHKHEHHLKYTFVTFFFPHSLFIHRQQSWRRRSSVTERIIEGKNTAQSTRSEESVQIQKELR